MDFPPPVGMITKALLPRMTSAITGFWAGRKSGYPQ